MKTSTFALMATMAVFGISSTASAEQCPVTNEGTFFNPNVIATCSDPQVGPKGDKGDKGDQGEQGIQGEKGDQGIAGKDFDPSDLEKGLATMGALTVPHIDYNKSFGISVSPSFYNEEAAIGFGFAGRLDKTWQLGGSVATDFDGENVAGKGVLTGQW